MLKRTLPQKYPRTMGIAFTLALSISGGFGAWASEQGAIAKGRPIFVTLKLTVSSGPSNEPSSQSNQYIAYAGERPTFAPAQPFDVRCTAFLPAEAGGASHREDLQARGIPGPVDGEILLDCTIVHDGKLVATPALITKDGQSAIVEMDDAKQPHHFRLEINASTAVSGGYDGRTRD